MYRTTPTITIINIIKILPLNRELDLILDVTNDENINKKDKRSIRKIRRKELLNDNDSDNAIDIKIMTNVGPFKTYLNSIDSRFCGMCDETGYHLLFECLCLKNLKDKEISTININKLEFYCRIRAKKLF